MSLLYLPGIGADDEKSAKERETLENNLETEVQELNYNPWIDSSVKPKSIVEMVIECCIKNKRFDGIIGRSTGGSIALAVASAIPFKDILLSAPTIHPFNPKEMFFSKSNSNSSSSSSFSLKQIYYLTYLAYYALSKANSVTSPTIILQGDRDKFLRISGANKLYEDIGTDAMDKELHIIENGTHRLISDDESGQDINIKVLKLMKDFDQKHRC